MTEFERDILEKTQIAASARRKKSRFRGKKGCRLPSDHLTRAELAALNGPIEIWCQERTSEYKP